MNALFILSVASGGMLQIAFTILLIMMFKHRNYAIGIALSKTEILQTAILEAIIIGYTASISLIMAILIGLVGIALVSYQKIEFANGGRRHLFFSSSHLLGIGSGSALALANICYFKATLLLGGDVLVLDASFTAAISSAAWFIAFAMFHLGAVRAVGQIELVISILFSWLFLKEKITIFEVAGIAILGISIILVLLYV